MTAVRSKKIFVAGHQGLAGSALVRILGQKGYSHVLTRTRGQLDLEDRASVFSFFETERPVDVILAAAKVGGILANKSQPYDFLLRNLKIQNNMIEAAVKFGVERFLFLGSNCMYPREAAQPIKEESLYAGKPEITNLAYATAKLAGLELCASVKQQLGRQFLTLVPTTLYGPGDNYQPENSHVFPALLRKVIEGKRAGGKEIMIWGSGKPKRELLYSDDFAEAAIFVLEKMNSHDFGDFINVASAHELSIREMAERLMQILDYKADLVFDSTKPDGAPRKALDGSRLSQLGWQPKTDFAEGVRRCILDFETNPCLRR